MNVRDRLQTLLGRAAPPEAPAHSGDIYPLGSIGRDIEEVRWSSLLEDMDRFSLTFKDEERPS
jgi:hypothetical protein